MSYDDKSTPKLAAFLLKMFTFGDVDFHIKSDLDEEFHDRTENDGVSSAKKWYYLQILKSAPSLLRNAIVWKTALWMNYLKIGSRNIKKHQLNFLINVFGLSMAFAGVILTLLFVSHERSYDDFHVDNERIYSMHKEHPFLGRDRFQRGVEFYRKQNLSEYFPQIEASTRMVNYMELIVKKGEIVFNERPIFTDDNFFEFFTFELKTGHKENVLDQDNTIVITEEVSHKYFGQSDPIGQPLTLSYNGKSKEFLVSGVAENAPDNSSIYFSFLLNVENMKYFYPELYWEHSIYNTFIKLENGSSIDEIETRIPEYISTYYEKKIDDAIAAGRLTKRETYINIGFQRLDKMYHGGSVHGIPISSDPTTSVILSGIALFILILACINYVNLYLGTISIRNTEIGVRKILGAGKGQMAFQFFGESLLTIMISIITGFLFAYLVLPEFNTILNKLLVLTDLFTLSNFTLLTLVTIFVAVTAGLLPSLSLFKFKPVDLFSNSLKFGSKKVLTKWLLGIQFSISLILLISTVIMSDQINYLLTQELGFNSENILYINTFEVNGKRSVDLSKKMRERSRTNPNILNVSGSSSLFNRNISYSFPIDVNGQSVSLHGGKVDYGFFEMMDLEIIQGRGFSATQSSDTLSAVVNKKFADILDKDDPIGKVFKHILWEWIDFKVIGVVEDYNFLSLESDIGPAMLHIHNNTPLRYILVKTDGKKDAEVVEYLEDVWKEINPDKPFTFAFMDENQNSAYNNFKRMKTIVNYSSIIAFLVTYIGIFCLTTLAISRRIKEIGIRKVLGAKVQNIYFLLVMEFLRIVVVANVIAFPVTWYLMQDWLQGFAYRINLDYGTFALYGLITLIFTIATISYQSLKSALRNPVDSLRYE